MRFDLVDLRLFLHVAEARSITHGACRANLALASASERIRGMEQTLGVALLARTVFGCGERGQREQLRRVAAVRQRHRKRRSAGLAVTGAVKGPDLHRVEARVARRAGDRLIEDAKPVRTPGGEAHLEQRPLSA